MAYAWKRLAGTMAGVGIALLLVGCQAQKQEGDRTPPAGESGPAAAASPNRALRLAAEPFEGLTEQAFTADWAAIDSLIADARNAVAKAAPSGGLAMQAKQRLAAIQTARTAQDRVQLALAAVEGYRELIEAQDLATASPPIAVSLLDYAGFRYDALAQAPTVNWEEMARSVAFARDQWQSLAPNISSKAMPGVVEQALAGMAKAVERKELAFARSAAATELALVDLLEEQVSPAR